ncbi:hypothetical protein [Agrobacterium rosae]|uniref:hypothetical protein n=1 Tax=Agrobacterium rosae TaxID=1972867 RepID=UPI003B9F6ADC
MSKQTTNIKSRSTAATVEKATGVQEDGVGITSTTSDPSGLRAPDGTNTGPADNAGSADDQNSKGHDKTGEASAAAPVASEPSQGAATGTGANAGSVQPTFDLDGVLIATGTASFEDLLHAASLGKRTVSLVEEIVVLFPELDRETPAEIVEALLEEATALKLEVGGIASFGGSAGTTSQDGDEELKSGANHPLTHTLLKDWDETRAPVIRITSKVAGFRRGGIAHPGHAVDHPIRDLSPDQLETLLGEPNLTVELV